MNIGQIRDHKLITDKYILGINSRNRPTMNRNKYILGEINKKLPREIIDLYVMIKFLK